MTLTENDPPAAHAAAALRSIEAEPQAFDMQDWIRDVGHHFVLLPDQSPVSCGTTLCVAGWIAHNAGHKVYPDGYNAAVGYATVRHVEEISRDLLRIDEAQGGQLFYSVDNPDRALAALRRIATGDQWPQGQRIEEFAGE